MKHLDLFSGIGGFALACQWAGIETILFVEIDKYCQKVLRKHFPGVPIVEDIRDVEKIKEIVANATKLHEYASNDKRAKGKAQVSKLGNSYSQRDIRAASGKEETESPTILVTAGFPCQPFSNAGKRGGEADDRYLWPETLAVIEAIKPRWVLLENVTGIINLALDTVLSDLEGAGYSYETLIVPACAVNAPHRRDRVWIVGHSIGNGHTRGYKGTGGEKRESEQRGVCQSQGAGDVANSLSREGRGERGRITSRAKDEGRRTPEDGGETVCPRTEAPLPGKSRQAGDIVSNAQSKGLDGENTEGNLCPTGRDTESGQRGRQADWWAVEPELCLLANGLSKELDGGRLNGNTINAGKEGTPFCWEEVRRLWFNYLSRSSSHGWRQDEQLVRELADILQRLSYPLALAKWQTNLETTFAYLYRMRQSCEAIGALRNASVTVDEAWQSLSEEDKDWVVMATARGQWVSEWPNTPRVASGIKERVNQLKCLGNAIVPQAAYEIIKMIKEVMELNLRVV